jgi:hypothetical protein
LQFLLPVRLIDENKDAKKTTMSDVVSIQKVRDKSQRRHAVTEVRHG